MKLHFRLFCLTTLLFSPLAVYADDTQPLAVPGLVIYESKLDSAVGAPWKVLKGKWELTDGSWRATEIAEDKHPGVVRLPNKLGDFVIEYEFKFEGAKFNSLSINGKGHMARVMITPKQVTIQKDDSDHDGPDKGMTFAKLPATFAPGTWHKVRMEMVGDTMRAQVDELSGWGKSELFKAERTAGITMAGATVSFRNFKISEATLNPKWDATKAPLPPVAR